MEGGATKDCIQVTLVLKEDVSICFWGICVNDQVQTTVHLIERLVVKIELFWSSILIVSLKISLPRPWFVCECGIMLTKLKSTRIICICIPLVKGEETNKSGIVGMSWEGTNVKNKV